LSEKIPRSLSFAEVSALASGHAEARAIQTALKLGLFEALAERPLDAHALGNSIGTNAYATEILADALAAIGLLTKSEGRFTLNQSSRRYLLRASDEYLGGMILFDESLWQVWGRLEDSIRSGRPARTPDMFQGTPEETERFIRAMDTLVRARGDASWVAENLDLSGVATIGDIGGGPGTYVAAMLRRYPRLRATIFDLPATLRAAERILGEREQDVRERISLTAFDYSRDELAGPLDALFLSNIIHSEDAVTNAMLFGKCFRALAPGGIIVVKDHIMNTDMTEPAAGAVFSLYLLLTTRGRDYSFDEVSSWIAAAGFTETELRQLPSPPFTSSMLIARKPR
jgi:SAM-dependent methyltransferase